MNEGSPSLTCEASIIEAFVLWKTGSDTIILFKYIKESCMMTTIY